MDESPVIKRDLMMDEYEKYYTVRHWCSNCRERNIAYVRKDHRSKGLTIKCDKCGCEETLS